MPWASSRPATPDPHVRAVLRDGFSCDVAAGVESFIAGGCVWASLARAAMLRLPSEVKAVKERPATAIDPSAESSYGLALVFL